MGKTKSGVCDFTQNFWVGCQPVSEGCLHCYARAECEKYERDFDKLVRSKTWGRPLAWQRRLAKTGKVEKVFTSSWSDFFHPDADQWRPEAWCIIKNTPNLLWQVLTKRAELIADRLPEDWGEGYVDGLISEKRIPNWESALGLYVVGRPDPEIHQLENVILGEKRSGQLRIISVKSLLSLAEMASEYDVNHGDLLAIIRPSAPTIDSVVDLMARLIAERQIEVSPEEAVQTPETSNEKEAAYWLTPVRDDEKQTADEVIESLVGQEKIYAFGERTPGRKHMKSGDWLCFYATAKGVVAHARAASAPEKKPHRRVRNPEKYPWTIRLDNAHLYLENPIVIDAATRSKLDAFRGRDPEKSWAWFVQATRRLSENDFRTLTRP